MATRPAANEEVGMSKIDERFIEQVAPEIIGLVVNKRGVVFGYVSECNGHNEIVLVPSRRLGRALRKHFPPDVKKFSNEGLLL